MQIDQNLCDQKDFTLKGRCAIPTRSVQVSHQPERNAFAGGRCHRDFFNLEYFDTLAEVLEQVPYYYNHEGTWLQVNSLDLRPEFIRLTTESLSAKSLWVLYVQSGCCFLSEFHHLQQERDCSLRRPSTLISTKSPLQPQLLAFRLLLALRLLLELQSVARRSRRGKEEKKVQKKKNITRIVEP